MKLLLPLPLLLTGCASLLPPGSYARVTTGYSKDGPSGKAVLHIPFTQGPGERKVDGPGASTLVVRR